MKISPLLVIIALIISSCVQNSKETEINNDGSEANVGKEWNIKVCKMYQSDFVLIDPNEKGQLIQEFRFNKEGFVNELIRYGIDGEIVGRFDIYGEHTPFPLPGKPEYTDTVLTVFNFDTSGMVAGKEIKIYNEIGLLTQVDFYAGEDSLIKRNTYKYDKNNMIQEDVYWDVDLDKPKQKIRYEFEYFID